MSGIFGCLLGVGERPIFTGDIKQYFSWRDDYKRLVQTVVGDDPFVLKSCVSGEALKLIDSGVSCSKMWARLDEIYGSERRFILSHINEIFYHGDNLEEDRGMISFINKITTAWDQLSYFDLKELGSLDLILIIVLYYSHTGCLEKNRNTFDLEYLKDGST